MSRKRFAIVGTGGRSQMFYDAICKDFAETSELVAFCDINQTRMDATNKIIADSHGHAPVPTYKPNDFEKMIKENNVDAVVVTTIDRTHHRYIIRAMEAGCDAISEKPMTVDPKKCQEILDAIKRTGKDLRVTFNYRYGPRNSKIRELIMNDEIGKVHAVHFEWLLDTKHGADYFRRWHRDKRNSGGLMVHKSTHHFDLVNFWLGSQPTTVFGMGDLNFYGRENAEERGIQDFYNRHHGFEKAKDDPYALDLSGGEKLKALYLDAEHEDGYFRDQSVFGDGISIEDTMNVMVRYQTGTVLNYQLTAYSPWEGFNIAFTGDKGRIEVSTREKTYVNSGGKKEDEGAHIGGSLVVHRLHEEPEEILVEKKPGGHGGGDPVMLNDIFGVPENDPLKRAASHVDGAMSILTGIAANKSFDTGLPINIDTLVKF